jgi:hypothetical protein
VVIELGLAVKGLLSVVVDSKIWSDQALSVLGFGAGATFHIFRVQVPLVPW